MPISERLQALIEQGQACLKSRNYDEAIEIGKRIEEEHFSFAFELMALAYLGKGDLREAIAVLERGVDMAPYVWLLWHLLGNCYSDMSRWADAQLAYARALECPDPDETCVHYNMALAFLREGRAEDALRCAENVTSPEFRLKLTALLIDIKAASSDTRGAVEYAEQVLADGVADDLEGEDAPDAAAIYSAYAHAVWKHGDPGRALELAWEAISVWKQLDRAQLLIRKIEDRHSDRANHYTLIIEGIWPASPEEQKPSSGFFVTYKVSADSPEEAFRLAERFEPEFVRESLRMAEGSITEEEVGGLKGVYSVSDYYMFALE